MGKGKPPLTPLLEPRDRDRLVRTLPKWRLEQESDGPRLERRWVVQDFQQAIDLVQAVADVAERLDHHPDLHVTDYKHVRVATWSHDAGGITERDVALAAAIDGLPAVAAI